MSETAMGLLQDMVKDAVANRTKYIAVRIEMDGFPYAEVIVNPVGNAEDKLAYYEKTYDSSLHHRFTDGIAITACMHGDDPGQLVKHLE